MVSIKFYDIDGNIIWEYYPDRENKAIRGCDCSESYRSMYGQDVLFFYPQCLFSEYMAYEGIVAACRECAFSGIADQDIQSFFEDVSAIVSDAVSKHGEYMTSTDKPFIAGIYDGSELVAEYEY